MKVLVTSLFGLLVFVSVPIMVATAGHDAMCEGLSGAAFGLCTAAVNVGCDNEETRKNGCAKIEEKFEQITGDTPPWTVPYCSDNTACAADQFCKKADGDCDGMGTCEPIPTACIDAALPAIACNGGEYGNYCYAELDRQSIRCYLSSEYGNPPCSIL